MFNLPDLSTMLISLPAIIIALTFHEFAHGFVAYKLGDPTAKNQGRLTLNPLPHLDPVGFFMLLFFHFGWAKPVPINPFYFEGDRKKGVMLVSFAGPLSNLFLALLAAIILGVLFKFLNPQGIIISMLSYLILINLVLAVFNLIPIPPLDGSKILAGILPGSSEWMYKLEQYGFLILILLMLVGAIGKLLNWIIYPIYELLLNLATYIYLFLV